MDSFTTATVGVFNRDDVWPYWWVSDRVPVPYFDNKKLLLVFINSENWQLNEKRLMQLDDRLKFFWGLGNVERKAISSFVHEFCLRHCIHKEMNCTWYENESGIWDFIFPTTICIVGKEDTIEIVINCDCPYIKCNGLQLRFSSDSTLPLISEIRQF